MIRCGVVFAVLLLSALSAAAGDAPAVRLYAAGSLRAAMTDIAKAYSQAYGAAVTPTFGGSGLLKDRLAKGEPADVFASADMGNPRALSKAGKSGPTALFARNHLCAILRRGLTATPASLLTTLLDPSVKVGTSTPIGDPAGDYAWALFKKAEALRPGSRAALEAKAVKIGNAPGSLAVPPGVKNAVAWLFMEKRADVFLAYCTGGAAVAAELPGTTTIQLPPSLAVEANYGLTIMNSANHDLAAQFALFVLSPPAQKILADHGFDAPLLILP